MAKTMKQVAVFAVSFALNYGAMCFMAGRNITGDPGDAWMRFTVVAVTICITVAYSLLQARASERDVTAKF
jgi:hypothetical protein